MRARGFTLIEILIVMVIISIVGAVAILTISQNENSRLDSLSKEMANMIVLAETQAMLQPTIIGLSISTDSYQFYQYQETKNEKDNPWRPLTASPFQLHIIPKGVQVTLKIEGKIIPPSEPMESPDPTLIISTNGDMTPFVILFGHTGSEPRYRIVGDENGNVKREKIS